MYCCVVYAFYFVYVFFLPNSVIAVRVTIVVGGAGGSYCCAVAGTRASQCVCVARMLNCNDLILEESR